MQILIKVLWSGVQSQSILLLTRGNREHGLSWLHTWLDKNAQSTWVNWGIAVPKIYNLGLMAGIEPTYYIRCEVTYSVLFTDFHVKIKTPLQMWVTNFFLIIWDTIHNTVTQNMSSKQISQGKHKWKKIKKEKKEQEDLIYYKKIS